MNNELESYLHVREAHDHELAAVVKPRPAGPHLTYSTPECLLKTGISELERVSGAAKVTIAHRYGQRVE